ncbi:MAG: UDP-N-acetylmuramoyl-L-alanine--D-glutamate ligase [Bacilli bacterium]|nr:UDP-N-acetylmuramoyl-L-alanine--D-glutamate ligase [Bacilli bacterium]
MMFTNKKILILGMARSGYEVAKLLAKYNNTLTITDSKEQDEERVQELKALGVKYILTDHPEDLLEESFDCMIKNPGVRKDQPAVVKAKQQGLPVINELEVAYHFLPKNVTIIGVTGSNGKTTTTTILYEILKRAKQSVYLAGNIGVPLSLTVQSMQENSFLVIEISDHQLLDMYDFKVDIAVMTNLSEVHLDFHGTYENYKNTKKKIFQNQTEKEYAILNLENKDVLEVSKDIKAQKCYFSSQKETDSYLKEQTLYLYGEKALDTNEIKLKGNHNYENIMCALLVLHILKVDSTEALAYLKDFRGVEHRNEFVKEVNKRKFYNDSKATNTESTITALSSFNSPVILILGGLDRGHSFNPLNPYLKHVKQIICYGETKNRIEAWAREVKVPCSKVDTLIEATKESYALSKEGDTIVFSPACASWDQYDNFEIRGDEFKKVVGEL